MVVVSLLPHAEFGPNDHREDAPHFNIFNIGIAAYIDPRVLLERYSESSGIL